MVIIMAGIKTVLLFDRYSVPVSMQRATVDTDVQLHEYHGEDRSRTSRKTVCSGCGRELSGDDIVKGYAYGDSSLVLLTRDDLKSLKTDSENYLLALYTTALSQISPVYFNASYIAVPQQGAEKPFELLRLSLYETQRILICKTVQGGVDALAAVLPAADGLLVIKLHPDNALVSSTKPYKKPPTMPGELDTVKSALRDMTADFDLSVYENEYQDRLRGLLSAKIEAGRDTYDC